MICLPLGNIDEKSFKISKQMTRLLRHQGHPRENDGAIEWRRLLPAFCRDHPDAPKWTNQTWTTICREDVTKKDFSVAWTPTATSLYMRAIQGHSGGNKVDPSLQDERGNPYTLIEYIYLVGSSHNCHSIIQSV